MNQRVLLGIIGGLVLLVGLLVGYLIGGGNDDGDTEAAGDAASSSSSTSSTTSEAPADDDTTDDAADDAADDASATTSSTTTSTTTTTTTTTTTLPPGSGTIVAGSGVAGWSEGGEWRSLDDGDLPAEVGEVYQIIRVGQPVTTATATEITGGCDFIDPSADVAGLMDFDDWPNYPIAVAASWDVVPHPVDVLPNDSQTYKDAISELLAQRGITDPDPTLRQVIRTDLEGDGVDEILITAGHDGDFSSVAGGDYSIAILRKVVLGEVQTAILGFHEVPASESGPFLIVYRIAAVADLNGDGRMEIATNDFYYEGAGSIVYDYINDDLGPWEVLNVGCGA